jgi:hypothetical protein
LIKPTKSEENGPIKRETRRSQSTHRRYPMSNYDYEDLELQLETVPVETNQDELDIPLDITDILSVCREYSMLGWQIQQQVENIVELGIQDAIDTRAVSISSLPHIRAFLKQVIANPYFGDAVAQAEKAVMLIDTYTDTHPITCPSMN